MSPRGLNSVYTYSDYRDYLRDYYSSRRLADSAFSHRQMAKELGFPSPNYIKQVMDGKRRLGLRSVRRLLDGLRLHDREKEYFCNLVFFCQATTSLEKNYYFGRLAAFRLPASVNAIKTKEYRYYNEWYNCVIRELIVRTKPPVDLDALARKVRPRITAAQAKGAVELLVELGLITKNADGGYEQTSRFISTDREVTSVGIRNYHRALIDLGKESLDTVERDSREISSLTLCLSERGMRRIKQRIQVFEDELLLMARDDRDVDRVYQLNFQFFPLSQEDV